MNITSWFALPFEDPVLVFATVMLLILVAPALARKARMPEIVGLLVAGMIVGPHAVGLLARDRSIELLGKVGLLFIMFLAGLEIDLHEVRKNRTHTLVFGLITFAVPLALGTVLGRWVFGMSFAAAILLASLFSSHTLLTFPTIGKLGLAKTKSVTTAIGGTIITDTLALLILAVVIASSQGDPDLWFWVRMAAFMVVYFVATLVVVPAAAKLFFRRTGSDEQVEFAFVMALVFVVSFLAHLAGLEPIIGAFLAGLTLNRLIPAKSLLMSRIHFTGEAIFVPFFLLSVGMLVDFRQMISGLSVWIVIGGMTGVALVSKWIAARGSALLLRYRPSEAGVLFGMSVNQAAATLAAVLIAYEFGLFDDTIITGAIMMIAVTCLTGSIVTARAGRKLALEEEQAVTETASAPPRIMLPVGAEPGSKELLDLALLLHAEGSGEAIYPIRVAFEGSGVEKELAEAEKLLARAVARATSVGVPVAPLTVVDLNVSSGLLRAIRDYRISLVVCGWNDSHTGRTYAFGRSIDRVIDATRATAIVTRFTAPPSSADRIVLVLPPYADRQVGFDPLVATVKTIARRAGCRLAVLTVAEVWNSAGSRISGARPDAPLEYISIPAWKSLPAVLEANVRGGDWIILGSARRGELAWQPSLERVPKRIAAGFPANSVSVLFPATVPRDSVEVAESVTTPQELIAGFSPDRTVFGLKTKSPRDAVERLLKSYFGRRSPNARAVADLLARIADEEPVELTDDVVLLHAHVPFVDETVVFLGVSREPLDIAASSGNPHILVVLLGSVAQDPAKHLKALADAAQVLRLPGLVPALKQVGSYADFRREVERRLRPD